jgi:hypothetical protein
MNRNIAVIPAMAYSISSLLKAVGGPGKTPHEDEEQNQDSYVEKIEHDSPRNRQKHDLMPCPA